MKWGQGWGGSPWESTGNTGRSGRGHGRICSEVGDTRRSTWALSHLLTLWANLSIPRPPHPNGEVRSQEVHEGREENLEGERRPRRRERERKVRGESKEGREWTPGKGGHSERRRTSWRLGRGSEAPGEHPREGRGVGEGEPPLREPGEPPGAEELG